MKIAFLGNANNFPFMLAMALRECGHDVRVYIDSDHPLDRPECKYPWVRDARPDWIEQIGSLPLSPNPRKVRRWLEVRSKLMQADLVVLNGFGIRHGFGLPRPVVTILTGTDIDLYADPDYPFDPGLIRSKPLWLHRPLGRFLHRLSIAMMRAAIRRTALVWHAKEGYFPRTDERLAALGIHSNRRIGSFLADVDHLAFEPPKETPHRLRLFNMCRLVWHEPLPPDVSPLANKRNDILIRGLGAFFRAHPDAPLDPVFVRKGIGLEHTYALIEAEGLTERVTWLEQLTQIAFYEEVRRADVVTDQFGNHAVSMACFEAMAIGRPVVANGRLDDLERCYGFRPPILEARTPEEVCRRLEELLFEPQRTQDVIRKGRIFVEEHCAPQTMARTMLERLERLGAG